MRIALVSDTHLAPNAPEFGANWQAVESWLQAESFDLVVHLGDITANGILEAQELVHARTILGRVESEMLFLPGNHDIGDNPPSPGRPAKHPLDDSRLADYRRLFGPDRWSRTAAGWRLIGLNAQLFGMATEEEEQQFRWLEAELAAAAEPVGLFLHKPLLGEDPDDPETRGRFLPLAPRRRLLALLGACDLRFVICGHTHQHHRLRHGAVEHLWMPSTAFLIPDSHQDRIGEKLVAAGVLELSDTGHDLRLAIPPGLAQLDLLDHPHVYPQLAPPVGSR